MSKFIEKDVLVEYDLDIELLELLEVNVIDIIPLRKVYILVTDSGKKILKKINYSKERLDFICICIEELKRLNNNVISFTKFKDGSYYKEWNDSIYVIMDLINGREACFSNELEYLNASESIAKLHLSGEEAIKNICKKINKEKKEIIDRSFIEKIEEAEETLKEIYSFVKNYRYNNELDDIFLNNYKEKVKNINRVKGILLKNNYEEYYEEKNNLVICHNDLVEHNFIIDDMNINLIDFDYLSIDYRVMDVANILTNGIKHIGYDFTKGMEMLKAYDEIYPLSKEEIIYVYALILFPKDFYLITKNYYFKQKRWSEEVFKNRYSQKIIEDKFKLEFLEQYKEWMKN